MYHVAHRPGPVRCQPSPHRFVNRKLPCRQPIVSQLRCTAHGQRQPSQSRSTWRSSQYSPRVINLAPFKSPNPAGSTEFVRRNIHLLLLLSRSSLLLSTHPSTDPPPTHKTHNTDPNPCLDPTTDPPFCAAEDHRLSTLHARARQPVTVSTSLHFRRHPPSRTPSPHPLPASLPPSCK